MPFGWAVQMGTGYYKEVGLGSTTDVEIEVMKFCQGIICTSVALVLFNSPFLLLHCTKTLSEAINFN